MGDRFRQYDSANPGGVIFARELARLVRREPHLAAISSHQAVPPAPRILGRKILTSILIRDPIARIGSIYSFERAQNAETPGALKAKQLDFKSYVEWRLEASPATFCNYQVHFCSGRKKIYGECDRKDLEAAIIRLDAIDIVGTVQRYDEWLALGQVVLGHAEALLLAPAHRNRSVATNWTCVCIRLRMHSSPGAWRNVLWRSNYAMPTPSKTCGMRPDPC